MARALKPGGRIIFRESSIHPDRETKKAEKIDRDFRFERMHWFNLLFDLYFYSDLSGRCREEDKHLYRLEWFYWELERAYLAGRISRHSIDALWWFKKDINHTVLPRFDYIDYLQKYFRLEPVEQAKDYKKIKLLNTENASVEATLESSEKFGFMAGLAILKKFCII